MKNTIKISVIIPVYNAEKFLKKAFDSVMHQAYVDEIIIVDDNSTDQSLEIAEGFKKYSPIEVVVVPIKTARNVGAGKARNIGISKAKNDFLAFLDVDDYYYSNRFEEAVSIFSKNATIDAVYEAVENVFSNNEARIKYIKTRPERYKTGKFKEKLTLYTMDYKVSSENLFEVLMRGDSGFFHFNGLLVKKDLIEKIGGLDESLKLAQDTDLFFKMAMIGNIEPGSIDNPVAARFIHESNRAFNDKKKITYFRLKKFHGLAKWAKSKRVDSIKKEIITTKNLKLCADEVLKIDVYKNYRIKMFFLKIFYPIIMFVYFKKNNGKYA